MLAAHTLYCGVWCIFHSGGGCDRMRLGNEGAASLWRRRIAEWRSPKMAENEENVAANMERSLEEERVGGLGLQTITSWFDWNIPQWRRSYMALPSAIYRQDCSSAQCTLSEPAAFRCLHSGFPLHSDVVGICHWVIQYNKKQHGQLNVLNFLQNNDLVFPNNQSISQNNNSVSKNYYAV